MTISCSLTSGKVKSLKCENVLLLIRLCRLRAWNEFELVEMESRFAYWMELWLSHIILIITKSIREIPALEEYPLVDKFLVTVFREFD